MKKINLRKQHITQLAFSFVILLLLFYLSSKIFFRLDFTSEKRYTLSPKTKEVLRSLDELVNVKIYLSGDMPVGFKKLRNSIQETLDEFRIYAGDNIQYEFINPLENPDPKVKERIFTELYQKGLKPTNIQVKEKEGGKTEKILFPGAIILYNGTEVPVNFLKNSVGLTAEENLNNTIQNIEYELVKTIYNLTNKKIDKIAFLEGHGELNELETGDITRELANYFQVDRGKISDNPAILNAYKAILIAKPTLPFPEKDKLVIDQYIMNGGKVIWFLNGVNVNIDSLANGATLGLVNSINLDDQLFTYGVRVNPNLVQDIQCNILPVQAGMNGNQPKWVPAPWMYYPLISPLVQHPVTRDLNLVFARFASTIDTIGSNALIKKTALLKTSEGTKLVNAPLYISLSEVKQNPKKEEFNKSNLPLAFLLEGQFKSVFRNRNANQIMPGWNKKIMNLSVPNKMIVVADGDMIANDVRMTPKGPMLTALGYDKYTQQTFGNKDFIVNAVSYLTDENGLLSLRSKEYQLRLLNKKRITEERFKWQFINTLLPVFIVILFGIIYNQRRKSKFTSQ
jgi:ABC-2 type transport system permease protein